MHNTPNAVADPGFPRGGGAKSKGGYKKLLFGQFFPKNCMKLKEFAHPWCPLRSANETDYQPLRTVLVKCLQKGYYMNQIHIYIS